MRKQSIRRWLALSILVVLCGCQSKTSSSSSGSGSGSTDSNSATNGQPAPVAEPTPPPPPPPLVVDAGTQFTVTIDQTVSTKTNSSGDHFAASLAAPVTVDGLVALPKGTTASGTVTTAEQAGRVKGSATLAITLDSLTVNGGTYSIATSTYQQTGKGRGKRTAIGAGGGAAAGGIIGGVAGGGKGAVIGLLAGGAAGTAGTAYTGNRDLSIPAETRVHFKLTQPLSVPQVAQPPSSPQQ
jgi:hypothetical protein